MAKVLGNGAMRRKPSLTVLGHWATVCIVVTWTGLIVLYNLMSDLSTRPIVGATVDEMIFSDHLPFYLGHEECPIGLEEELHKDEQRIKQSMNVQTSDRMKSNYDEEIHVVSATSCGDAYKAALGDVHVDAPLLGLRSYDFQFGSLKLTRSKRDPEKIFSMSYGHFSVFSFTEDHCYPRRLFVAPRLYGMVEHAYREFHESCRDESQLRLINELIMANHIQFLPLHIFNF